MAERWRQHLARAATAARQGDRETAERERRASRQERVVAVVRDALSAADELTPDTRQRIVDLVTGGER